MDYPLSIHILTIIHRGRYPQPPTSSVISDALNVGVSINGQVEMSLEEADPGTDGAVGKGPGIGLVWIWFPYGKSM